jgi:hypothetical protein
MDNWIKDRFTRPSSIAWRAPDDRPRFTIGDRVIAMRDMETRESPKLYVKEGEVHTIKSEMFGYVVANTDPPAPFAEDGFALYEAYRPRGEKTLRDEFAMAALTAIVSNEGDSFMYDYTAGKVAERAYGIADAMLAARAVKP